MEPILKSLGVDLPSVVWHLINFIILILILQRFLYKPILTMLDHGGPHTGRHGSGGAGSS